MKANQIFTAGSCRSRIGTICGGRPSPSLRPLQHRTWMCMLGFICAGLLIGGSASQAAPPHLAFSLKTVTGESIALQPDQCDAAAVCFLGTECPMARGYATQLNQLQRDFASQGVRLIGVMSNHQDSPADIAGYAEELGITFPLVQDVGNLVADRYGATRTPEVFLLDRQLKLRYRGRIDDQLAPGVARATATRQDLRIAIEELLAGKPVSVPATTALGCIIGRVVDKPPVEPAQGAVTYSNQVARVLQRHCIECHREGEIGPFAMDSYDEVLGWAETMLETIEQGRMPPWHADPQYGDFVNARAMPEEDKQLLRDWIAGGMPRGDQSDLPPSPAKIEDWNLPRPPDLIVEMRSRPFTVPKDGVVEYQYFVADPGLTEDTWITAAQVIPGSRQVVHHAIVFVRPPDGAKFQGIGWLSAYVPGQRIHELPPGRARKVPAGSKFVFQMHYTPNGVEQTDVTKVGLLIGNPEDVTHEVFTLIAINQEFEIPPQAASHVVQGRVEHLPRGAELLAITPHMHVRGKSFRLSAEAPPATTLLHVPNYDFNWQHTYQLADPLPLDQLQGLKFAATFDNSTGNPFNPNPHETVTWGDQTWEEMAVAFFEVARPLHADVDSSVSEATAKQRQDSADGAREQRIKAYIARVFAELDANADGQIKKAEADIVVRHMHFDLWDLDGDNVATQAEVRAVAEKINPAL